MSDGWKLFLQICGVVIAVWIFATSFLIGVPILIGIAALIYGWNYFLGDGSLLKKSESSKKVEIPTDDTKVILQCPNCNAKLRAPTGKTIEIKCKFCKYQWITKT